MEQDIESPYDFCVPSACYNLDRMELACQVENESRSKAIGAAERVQAQIATLAPMKAPVSNSSWQLLTATATCVCLMSSWHVQGETAVMEL